jgi:hypothetical protein
VAKTARAHSFGRIDERGSLSTVVGSQQRNSASMNSWRR